MTELTAEFDGEPALSCAMTQDSKLALVDLGRIVIGIHVRDLREVMAAPKELQAFQSSQPAVIGCVALRGQIIPVVDIAPVLGLTPVDTATDGNVIVILGRGEHVYGMLAKTALRIVPAQDGIMQQISRDQGALADQLLPEFRLIDSQPIGILDPTVLPRHGVPQSRAERSQRQVQSSQNNYLTFEMDGVHYCLPLCDIGATLPDTEIDTRVMRSGFCEGSVTHHGTERALVNLNALLGMSGRDQPVTTVSSVLLPFGAGQSLALRADRVLDISTLSGGQITPMPSVLSYRSDLFAGVHLTSGGREVYVLDGKALIADETLAMLSKLEQRSADIAASKPTGTSTLGHDLATALLVQSGGQFAFNIEVIEEIVAMPEAPMNAGSYSAYRGNLHSRSGRLIPTYCLATLLGQYGDHCETATAIVLIKFGEETIGLMVDRICAIEQLNCIPDGPSGTVRMLQRRHATDQTLWRVIDPMALPVG
ncbi:chemotaxis protein CheW [Thioclava kandeliae]|uniref:Chemotaxis protein CheW n=1 Tax=Thioclava kandeliae TaxID=3070818 RepID=A0ABV1SDL8_9RHOB